MTAQSFEDLGLHDGICSALLRLGYRAPWPVQCEAIPPLLEGRDLIGVAPTGSGKTVAFVAPALQRLGRRRAGHAKSAPRALIITPTRELARQVSEECSAIAPPNGPRVVCVYGKVGMTPQADEIARGVDVLVGTPGRLRELDEAGAVRLEDVEVVVLDEADRMLDLGFKPQVQRLLDRVGAKRQTVLFTATMPGAVETLARTLLDDPVRIQVGPSSKPADNVEQHVYLVPEKRKVAVLLELFEDREPRAGGAIVFCRTRRRVGWVGAALIRHGLRVGMIHGDRTQPQRIRALDDLIAGKLDIVVATDVAGRGLHLPRVDAVVNYDLPGEAEEFVHRVGRAGHGGHPGTAWTLVAPRARSDWNEICQALGLTLTETPAPGETTRLEPSTANDKTRRRKRRPGSRGAAKPIRPGEKPGSGVKRIG